MKVQVQSDIHLEMRAVKDKRDDGQGHLRYDTMAQPGKDSS